MSDGYRPRAQAPREARIQAGSGARRQPGRPGGPRNRPPARTRRPAQRPAAARVAGLVTYGVACLASVAVLATSGITYFVVGNLNSLGSSNAISPSAPKSKDGSENILLIGLDSRKDNNGNDLPQAVINQLHAGSKAGIDNGVGGYNTNTLILMHVPNDGSQASAFSIPRDDYVSYVDAIGPQQRGKIKEAYGVTKAYKENALVAAGQHYTKAQLEHLGREAARHATIMTVQKLVGVPIDHFAEINLGGFYDLAKVLGTITVCVKQATSDSYSGANLHKGLNNLNAGQALAFVRQRHGLPNGDLDRTHRQQAFLTAVTHKLKQDGVFSDLGKMSSLLDVAKRDVVMDKQFDVLGFAQQATNLTGGKVKFYTLPIKGFVTINGQSDNLIDPAAIKDMVQRTFGYPTTGSAGSATTSSTLDVYNGSIKTGLAARISAALVAKGYTKGVVASGASRTKTVVRYGSGTDTDAKRIAAMMGARAVADATVQAGHVEIDVGANGRMPTNPPATTVKPKATSTKSTYTPPASGMQGGAVAATNGIACVN